MNRAREDRAGNGIPGAVGPTVADVMSTATVLVVDDQLANVALLMRILQSSGIDDVHGMTDPRQAVERCRAIVPDLVLLDLHMPHMDGLEVMAALGSQLPDDAFVPVMVLTADSTTVARDRALDAGAKDFLTKPFDLAEVRLRVRNLLETRALYAEVQRHNVALQRDLDRRAREERRLAAERQQRVERIDAILDGDALSMVFQPVVNLSTGQVVGVEALARFACEPLRSPDEWFAEAAGVGRGAELELAAVTAALAQLDRVGPAAFMSVNISPATAAAPALQSLLEDVPAHRVVLELTEHVPVDDYESLLAARDFLHDRGVRLAVDDAGAGYSGLRHVLRLRPDILKLDIALTSGIDHDPAKRALSTALVAFAREIGATIVAEGIETAAEKDTLCGQGVALGQGYHLGRPGPLT